MTTEIKITKHSHHWLFEQSFSCADNYDQFLNWLRFEFYFLQQESGKVITLYFPNGQVQITKEVKADKTLLSKISLESKCRKVGLKMKKRLSDFLDHIDRYHSLFEF